MPQCGFWRIGYYILSSKRHDVPFQKPQTWGNPAKRPSCAAVVSPHNYRFNEASWSEGIHYAQKQPCRFSLQVCQINEKRLRYRTRPQNQYEANAGQSNALFKTSKNEQKRKKRKKQTDFFQPHARAKAPNRRFCSIYCSGSSLHIPHSNNGRERHHDRGQDRRNNGRHTIQCTHKRKEIVQGVIEDTDHDSAENLDRHTACSRILISKRHRKQQHD